MDFFEKLGKKASETYKTAAEKTNKIANETKLKLKINDNKSKINEVYKEIGKKVYQKYILKGNIDIKDDIDNELSRITELTNEIEEYESEILKLSDMTQCVNCKVKIEKNAKFCPECGKEQPIEEKNNESIENNKELAGIFTESKEEATEKFVEEENKENE